MYKTEAEFTTAYLKKFKKDWWAFKIPDISIWFLKPFDFFWVNEKWIHFVEVKIIEKDTFNFSCLRDNQITALSRIYKIIDLTRYNKFIYCWILIYSKKYNSHLFMSIDVINEFIKQEKKSIKLWF